MTDLATNINPEALTWLAFMVLVGLIAWIYDYSIYGSDRSARKAERLLREQYKRQYGSKW